MIQFLGPLLGGLGGLLFPAAAGAAAGGAAATGIGALLAKGALPALGAGLGTLVSGGNGKDAIRNALMMGVGVNAFPGLAGKIQGSGFGQSITGGLADIFGGGTQQAPATSPRPMSRLGSGPADMAPAGDMPDSGQGEVGMEDEARRRGMTTLPTLQEMASLEFGNAQGMGLGSPRFMQSVSPDVFSGAREFESRAGLPLDLDEYLNLMDLREMPGLESARGMGLGSPRFMQEAVYMPKIDEAVYMPKIDSVSPDVFSGAREFESRAGLPPDLGSPRFMPVTGDVGRRRDLQTAVSNRRMALNMALAPLPLILGGSPSGLFPDLLDIYTGRARGLGFAVGGEIEGPGTGTSDSIPAEIYQDGKPVQKAALSDGEFVMTANAVKGAGKGSRERGVSRMYELMRRFESGEMA